MHKQIIFSWYKSSFFITFAYFLYFCGGLGSRAKRPFKAVKIFLKIYRKIFGNVDNYF